MQSIKSRTQMKKDSSTSEQVPDASAALRNWMCVLHDSTHISRISLPGTHDSGALHEPIIGTAQTQTLSIGEQLAIGVRYLDIRLRHYRDALVVHHGPVYQRLTFDDVLTEVTQFLTAHPTETVLMEVSEEYRAYKNSRTFEQTFMTYQLNDQYRPFWWTHNYIPTIGDVRGKIVLLRRYSGSFWASGGVDITAWADNAEFDLYDPQSQRIHIQDCYKVSATTNNHKWRSIVSNLTAANESSDNTLFINFTSGNRTVLGIPNYPTVASDINKRLVQFLINAPDKHHGILVSDFSTETLTRTLLHRYLAAC